MVRHISYSDARAGLKTVMDQVCEDHTPMVITRQAGPDVVMLSLDDYNSIAETLHLLGSESNASRLRRSIAQIRAGKAKTKELYQDAEKENRFSGTEQEY